MLIRPETPDDAAVIAEVHTCAFGHDSSVGKIPDEVGLVAALRRSDAWLPSLSLVAESEGRIIGHCLTSRAHVVTEQVLALGPIGVVPAWQRRGVGRALTEATIKTANSHGEILIGLVGDPRFYGRFGFVPSTEVHITPPDASWGRYFQILALDAYRSDVAGEFRYPPPFDDL